MELFIHQLAVGRQRVAMYYVVRESWLPWVRLSEQHDLVPVVADMVFNSDYFKVGIRGASTLLPTNSRQYIIAAHCRKRGFGGTRVRKALEYCFLVVFVNLYNIVHTYLYSCACMPPG